MILWSSLSQPVEDFGGRQARWILRLDIRHLPFGIGWFREVEFSDAPNDWYPTGYWYALWFDPRRWRLGIGDFIGGGQRTFYLGPIFFVWNNS